MKKRYDFTHAFLLILILIIAYFVGNSIVKGVLLLLFSIILIFNAIIKLKSTEDKFKDKVFMGILLFLDSVLALSAVYVIVSAIVDAL